MKTKHAIYILACGFILVFGGAILKLMNFNGGIVIVFGMVVQAIGVLLLIIKLTNHPKIKDLMNS